MQWSKQRQYLYNTIGNDGFPSDEFFPGGVGEGGIRFSRFDGYQRATIF